MNLIDLSGTHHHHQTKKSEVTHTHKGVVEATGFRLNFQPVFQILENRILHNKITVNLACHFTVHRQSFLSLSRFNPPKVEYGIKN